jgi:UDP-N-acetylmuramoylalanine--D-glutamate ligase
LQRKIPKGVPFFPEPIAVLGYGVEGRSTLLQLQRWGYGRIEVLDRLSPKAPLPEGIRGRFGPDYLQGLQDAATAIRSPGVRPAEPEIVEFQARGGMLTSQVETLFSLLGPDRLVGVTGTLGKGTCCSLLSAMLHRGGIPHKLAGNIGVPAWDVLDGLNPEAKVLLELSSFQLSTLRQSPALAAVLKTTSEHLDWHASQAEYWDHKANLTRHQKPSDLCAYFVDAPGSEHIGLQGLGRKISMGREGIFRISDHVVECPERNFRLELGETRLLGNFNLENLAAASALALELGATVENIRAAAREFSPLEHRLEFVCETGGISYYNDSYATRPEAALAAVQALRGKPLGLILGGSEKFADFGDLSNGLALETHVRVFALIGQTAPRLQAALESAGALQDRVFRECASLQEAVDFLRGEVATGSILLSPACASFGLFADYKERGLAFKRLVLKIRESG